jgi:hypothetical protein
MAGMPLRGATVLGIALLSVLVFLSPAPACPFCSMQGQTLMGYVNQSSMVLFGTLTNAQLGADGGGTTDLIIEEVLKKDPILGDKKVLTLPRYVPVDKNAKTKFLIACDVYKGKIDPYFGVPVPADSDMVKYLNGAMAVKDKDISTRLRFYFDFLDNHDTEISNDAYKEFGNADYKDYREMAKHLPAEKIVGWLKDPNTPAFRYGLYASMLGHCGTAKDADFLRQMLEDPQKRVSSGVDGILAGYTMLKPKEGWAYISALMKDPSKEFLIRYAALRAARFFWDSRPDVLDKKDLVDGVCQLLNQEDVADLAIEDLRKWDRWEVAERVLDLYGKKSHDVPIIRRAILRYALSCQQQVPRAAAFVADLRKRDPETVKDAEELLKLENGKP